MSLDAPFLLTALGLVAAALLARQRAVRFGLELRNLHTLMRRLVLGGLALADAVLSVFPLAWALHRVGSDLVGSLTLTQWGFAFATLLSLGLLIWLRWTMNARPGVL